MTRSLAGPKSCAPPLPTQVSSLPWASVSPSVKWEEWQHLSSGSCWQDPELAQRPARSAQIGVLFLLPLNTLRMKDRLSPTRSSAPL